MNNISNLESTNYIIKDKENEIIIDEFCSTFPSNLIYAIIGIKGMGKTLFLNNIYNIFNNKDNFLIIKLSIKENIIEELAKLIYKETLIKFNYLKDIFSFSFHGDTFSIEGNTLAITPFIFIKLMLDIFKNNKKMY